MHIVFSQTEYVLKQQGLAIGGKYRLFGLQQDEPLLYIEEKVKWFPPSTTTHMYADEKKGQEILTIQENEDADMDVIDAVSGQKIGGIEVSADDLSEFIKDAWAITDADNKPIGKVFEKSVGRSVLREALDNELPQQMDVTVGDTLVAELRQKVKMVGYELAVDFSMDTAQLLDRRLGIAAAVFIALHHGSGG
jgi:hypothetical protein